MGIFRKRGPSLARQLQDMGERMAQVARGHETILARHGRTAEATGYGWASTPKRMRMSRGESDRVHFALSYNANGRLVDVREEYISWMSLATGQVGGISLDAITRVRVRESSDGVELWTVETAEAPEGHPDCAVLSFSTADFAEML